MTSLIVPTAIPMFLNPRDEREAARRKLPGFIFDFIDGAAEDEKCLHANRDALDRVHLLPKTLVDTAQIDMRTEIFGGRWDAPIGVAPLGFTGAVRPHGDIALARAAAAQGVPFVLSTASNSRLEDVRREALSVRPDAQTWMQLYVMSERKIAEQLVRRAADAGFNVLVLTVDTAMSGLRERDERNGLSLPFKPSARTLWDMALRPRWTLAAARHGTPDFVNLMPREGEIASEDLQAALLSRTMDRRLAWEHLTWIRRMWPGTLLLKGILHPQDARQAIEHGVDGIVVSNHGGRQLDAAPPTISALPAIVSLVAGRIPIVVDSGFRRGSDIAKALALGADAVFLGRPALWSLASGGETHVAAMPARVKRELERTMVLMGIPSISQFGTEQVHGGNGHAARNRS